MNQQLNPTTILLAGTTPEPLIHYQQWMQSHYPQLIIVWSTDVTQTLTQLHSGSVRLLLLLIDSPEVLDQLDAIRAAPALSQLPIIVIGDEPLCTAALARGANDCLCTPLHRIELIARINQHITLQHIYHALETEYQSHLSRNQRINRLLTEIKTLHSISDINLLFTSIVEAIQHLLQTDYAVVELVENRGEFFVIQAAAGIGEQWIGYKTPWYESISGEMVRTGASFTSHDVQELAQISPTFHTVGIRSILSVPLERSSGQIFGALSTGFFHVHDHSEDERQMLQISARYSAALIQKVWNDRLTNQLVSSASHDLRSPLVIIAGYAQSLRRAGPLNDQQQRFVERIEVSTRRLAAMVGSLLDLSRANIAGQIQREVCDLNGILRSNADEYMAAATQHQIQLTLLPSNEQLRIKGDVAQLRQLFDNLVLNAIKYTPAGGYVEVLSERMRNDALIRVRDTGPGFAEGEKERIFERYYRGQRALTSAVEGSGLGLAIVKEVVELHHGRIWVEGGVERGSVFNVLLPLSEEAP